MAKLFGSIVAFILLLGGCAVAMDKASSRNDVPVVQATDGATGDNSGSNTLQFCIDLVDTKPGDTAFIQAHGWKIVCSQSGDPELDASGDLETLGYTDFEKETIFLDANFIDEALIVHEAAHALDGVAFDFLIREKAAMDLGEADWQDADSYWKIPAETFAEGRAGCLGYKVDPDFELMTCEMIAAMIARSEYADEINDLVTKAK